MFPCLKQYLLDPRAQVETVCEDRAECDHVEKGGDSVQLAELLVQGGHLLGVRRGVPASLAVLCLCVLVTGLASRSPSISWLSEWSTSCQPVAFLGLTLLPTLRGHRIRRRQVVGPVHQPRRKRSGQRHQYAPAVVLVQHAAQAARADPAARVRQGQHGGEDGLDAEVGGEQGALQDGELRALEDLERGCGVDKGLHNVGNSALVSAYVRYGK